MKIELKQLRTHLEEHDEVRLPFSLFVWDKHCKIGEEPNNGYVFGEVRIERVTNSAQRVDEIKVTVIGCKKALRLTKIRKLEN